MRWPKLINRCAPLVESMNIVSIGASMNIRISFRKVEQLSHPPNMTTSVIISTTSVRHRTQPFFAPSLHRQGQHLPERHDVFPIGFHPNTWRQWRRATPYVSVIFCARLAVEPCLTESQPITERDAPLNLVDFPILCCWLDQPGLYCLIAFFGGSSTQMKKNGICWRRDGAGNGLVI